MLNHHRAEHLLSAYLDGELPPQEAAAVQEHLLDCAGCRETYERLRGTKGLLGQLPLAEPPADLWPVLLEPAAGGPDPGDPGGRPARGRGLRFARIPRPRRWPALLRRPAWAIAAALAVLLLAAVPLVKGTVDRLHATEIGVDLYVREHAIQMSREPLADRAYLDLVATDADLVLVGETSRAGEGGR